VINNTTLLVIIVSLFACLGYGRWKLSKKIIQGRIEKHRPVPWLWIQERALLWFGGVLVIRLLAPCLFVGVLHPLATVPVGTFGENGALRLAGLVLLVAAIVLQIAAQSELGGNWSHAVHGPIVREGSVTAHGLYRFSRNPMYCGSLAEVLALVFVLQNLAAVALLGATLWYVWSNIKREEALLAEVKGEEYALYCKSTPRFFWWL